MVNKNKEIYDAILNIDSTAKVIVTGNTLDTVVIDWLEGTTPISKLNIETKIVELKTKYNDLAYARNREKEYPSIKELIVALYDTEDKLAIENKRAAIKLKYPKENS